MNNTEKQKILILEGRGCDFTPATEPDKIGANSDVGNYRACASFITKANERTFISFSGYRKQQYRTVNKKNGAPLKTPVLETIKLNALNVEIQKDTYNEPDQLRKDINRPEIESAIISGTLDQWLYEGSWGCHDYRDELNGLQFTKAGILKAIEIITGIKYADVKIVKNCDSFVNIDRAQWDELVKYEKEEEIGAYTEKLLTKYRAVIRSYLDNGTEIPLYYKNKLNQLNAVNDSAINRAKFGWREKSIFMGAHLTIKNGRVLTCYNLNSDGTDCYVSKFEYDIESGFITG